MAAFDVETTGLIVWDRPVGAEEQPRICQIGLVWATHKGEEVGCFRARIRPDGWAIGPEASKVNGLTTAQCARTGIPIGWAMGVLMGVMEQADDLIAHNLEFDARMIERELLAIGASACAWKRPGIQRRCTAILGRSLGAHWKRPKLTELVKALFNEDLTQTHDGLDDARQALRCYLELKARGHVSE